MHADLCRHDYYRQNSGHHHEQDQHDGQLLRVREELFLAILFVPIRLLSLSGSQATASAPFWHQRTGLLAIRDARGIETATSDPTTGFA